MELETWLELKVEDQRDVKTAAGEKSSVVSLDSKLLPQGRTDLSISTDEARPQCQRCLRAGTTCLGYARDLKWIHEGDCFCFFLVLVINQSQRWLESITRDFFSTKSSFETEADPQTSNRSVTERISEKLMKGSKGEKGENGQSRTISIHNY